MYMSWNEPGGDNKDPWSGRGDQKGPPDLDEAIRSFQEKISGIFGGGSGGESSSGGAPLRSLSFLALAALVLWALSGFYIVDEGNRGVETRFGKYVNTTMPGLNWHLPVPIEQVAQVNIEQQRFIEVGYRSGGRQQTGSVPREALMLTKDENIVDIRLAVQYQIKDAKEFLFNVLNPAATLKQVTESTQRGVIGRNTMDFVLTEGRSEIVADIKTEIQQVLDTYQAGIQITSVNLQDAQPPEQVQGAFEDAIKAREDKQRLINEAQGYYNDVIPKARGAASRQTQGAEAYKARVVAQSEGESSRFSQLLTEYRRAPEVTRKRLYIEAMESVYARTNTIMVDVKGGNNLLYLPLDKLTQRQPVANTTQSYQQSKPASQQSSINNTGSTRGRTARGR
jgi:membrane protease subunit HflK